MNDSVHSNNRIGFIAGYDIFNEKNYFSPARLLFDGIKEIATDEVSFISPFIWNPPLLERIRRRILNYFYKKSNLVYQYETDPLVAAHFSKYYKQRIKDGRYKILISWFTTFELSYLPSSIPLVILRDAVFPSLINWYDGFFNLADRCIRNGIFLEQKTFNHTQTLLFSSRWGVKEFNKYYHLDGPQSAVLDVVMFGPNLRNIPEYQKICEFRSANQEKGYSFFLPVSSGGWFRKGGDKAIEIIQRLNQVGISSKLIVCGDIPDIYRTNPNVEVLPYLRKNNPDQLIIYETLLAKSDFLLFPTQVDFTPHVICEANAFGLPVFSSRVAGIPEMVIDGVNGFTFESSAEIDEYVNTIKMVIEKEGFYNQLRRNSRQMYEKQLNWSNCCRRSLDEINRSL